MLFLYQVIFSYFSFNYCYFVLRIGDSYLYDINDFVFRVSILIRGLSIILTYFLGNLVRVGAPN
jgi:hypothetical protein